MPWDRIADVYSYAMGAHTDDSSHVYIYRYISKLHLITITVQFRLYTVLQLCYNSTKIPCRQAAMLANAPGQGFRR